MSGLVISRREEVETTVAETVEVIQEQSPTTEPVELDEDERARQALLASVNGETTETNVAAIPVLQNDFSGPLTETDAYRQDVLTRPDSVCQLPFSFD